MTPESFWTLRLPDVINALILLATIAAIIYGPIKAVDIARRRDVERDADARKRLILSTLMRTRKTVMNLEHVGALNQIQLEFFNHPVVIAAYKNYIANLSDTVPPPGNALENFMKRRSDLFFDLLHAVAAATGVVIDRHDLDRLAYMPFGWQTEQNELQLFRTALIEVLQGRQALHVVNVPPGEEPAQPAHNPFPPPP
jgi:hypothetical protein